MFDVFWAREKVFEAGLSGFPRRPMSKDTFGVFLLREKLFEARNTGLPVVTCQSYVCIFVA